MELFHWRLMWSLYVLVVSFVCFFSPNVSTMESELAREEKKKTFSMRKLLHEKHTTIFLSTWYTRYKQAKRSTISSNNRRKKTMCITTDIYCNNLFKMYFGLTSFALYRGFFSFFFSSSLSSVSVNSEILAVLLVYGMHAITLDNLRIYLHVNVNVYISNGTYRHLSKSYRHIVLLLSLSIPFEIPRRKEMSISKKNETKEKL